MRGLALIVGAWVSMAIAASAQPQGKPTSPGLDELRRTRRDLAHRARRVIFNNDGCDCFYYPKNQPATAEGFLARRTTDLAGTHVDAIAYCTISAGFSNFTHRTKEGTLLVLSADKVGIHPDRRNITPDLVKQGTDCLQAEVDFAHGHGQGIFWSMRMNDTHDSEHRPDKPYMLFPPLKQQHPEWLVGEPIRRTPFGRWSSVDYARPEIRDLALRFIREVCENYAVDGVELDFFRHPCFFKSTAMGKAAGQAERDQMTDLMRRVRTMTEEVGLRRGRPILVAMRVPDSLEYCGDLGLDLQRWLDEGLLDMLVTTCYFRLNPWQYSVDLGHKHGVTVYPCLSDSRVTGESRFHRASVESFRGQAMEAWAAGADGIHLFNFGNTTSALAPVLREIGDPKTLRLRNKLYFATVRDGNPRAFLAGGMKYQHVPILTPVRAQRVVAGRPLTLAITLAEEPSAAGQATHPPKMTLHLQMPDLKAPEHLAVKCNARALTGGKLDKTWLDVPLPAECVRQGKNVVELSIVPATGAAAAKPASQRCCDLVVSVTYDDTAERP